MIEIRIWRDSFRRIRAFRVDGHSGHGRHGEDIVCAAVSALTQTAVIGLEECLGLNPEVQVGEGRLNCRLLKVPESREGEVAALLETMLLGLQGIAAEYPENLRIIEGEVE